MASEKPKRLYTSVFEVTISVDRHAKAIKIECETKRSGSMQRTNNTKSLPKEVPEEIEYIEEHLGEEIKALMTDLFLEGRVLRGRNRGSRSERRNDALTRILDRRKKRFTERLPAEKGAIPFRERSNWYLELMMEVDKVKRAISIARANGRQLSFGPAAQAYYDNKYDLVKSKTLLGSRLKTIGVTFEEIFEDWKASSGNKEF